MNDQATRYPLAWPTGWKRTVGRQNASFGKKAAGEMKKRLNLDDAVGRLQMEMDRLGAADGAVISTNLRLRLDGRPRGDQGEPTDPGVAVYFRLKKQDRVLACDRYYRVADNIAAIAAHIEALRAIERYGVGTLEQAFAGYASLPSAPDAWWLVLNLPQSATLDQIEARFRELARTAHPDVGGSHHDMSRLTAAREAARTAMRSA